MNRNLHEWYLDVGIILQDGQLEKRVLGIEKCVEALEKEKTLATQLCGLQHSLNYMSALHSILLHVLSLAGRSGNTHQGIVPPADISRQAHRQADPATHQTSRFIPLEVSDKSLYHISKC